MRRVGMSLLLGLVTLLAACSPITLEPICVDVPGRPGSCDQQDQAQPELQLIVESEAFLPGIDRTGYIPLTIRAKLQSPLTSEGPVLWDFGDGTRSYSALDEWVKHTYELVGRYTITATHGEFELSTEIVALTTEAGDKLQIPWRRGELCDARLLLFDEPKPATQVEYKIEVLVKAPLDALFVWDYNPYRTKYETSGTWVLPKPGRYILLNKFSLSPQWDYEEKLWRVVVKCVSDTEAEELELELTL